MFAARKSYVCTSSAALSVLEPAPVRVVEPRNKIMRIAPYVMRGYIMLDDDGAGGPSKASTAKSPARRGGCPRIRSRT